MLCEKERSSSLTKLGSSLHPQLSRLIIDWFEDPEINMMGAQLIFTSHDMTLLDAGRGDREKREQVWFVEKGTDGASELFNLSDFPSTEEKQHRQAIP